MIATPHYTACMYADNELPPAQDRKLKRDTSAAARASISRHGEAKRTVQRKSSLLRVSSQLEHAVQTGPPPIVGSGKVINYPAPGICRVELSTVGDIFHFQMCMSSSTGAIFYRFSPPFAVDCPMASWWVYSYIVNLNLTAELRS